ncbi:hypothetical protein KA005_67120 [bacterium]|nr:hypothetical protein [bacterium]
MKKSADNPRNDPCEREEAQGDMGTAERQDLLLRNIEKAIDDFAEKSNESSEKIYNASKIMVITSVLMLIAVIVQLLICLKAI